MKILAITPYEKWDCLASLVLEGLKKISGIELYCTYPGNGAINIITDEEFIAHYPTTDCILAIWGKQEAPPPKWYLIDEVDGWDKTAYIDGSEWNYTGYRGRTDEQLHPLFLDKARWYFKRECLPAHYHQGIVPFQFGAMDADYGAYVGPKDIDVLCAFGQTGTGLRREAVQACKELQAEGVNVVFAQQLTFAHYLNMIRRSWITVEAHGGGECNARMWHIMANQSALFAQRYNIAISNLVPYCHYIPWSHKEGLKEKIKRWLTVKAALASLILDGHTNLLQNHTSAARAAQLIAYVQGNES